MPKRISILVCLSLLVWLLPLQAQAQEGGSVTLSTPDASDFPFIRAYLDVHDTQGAFVYGLKAEQVQMIENGAPIPATRLVEQRPGAQWVVAINPGPSFAIRNNKAVSRYDLIKEALRYWGKSRMGTDIDDLSLIITNGASVSHTTDAARWLEALDSDQVNARAASPNLDTLFRAITLASDISTRPGMGRAILFITSPPEGQLSQPIENLVAQAREQQVPIHIWLVSSSGAVVTQAVQQLMSLAAATGGDFFTFTGEETLPSPEAYLAPLRTIYLAEYQSSANAAGTHQVVAQVQFDSGPVKSNSQIFEINLQAPQPAFVAPPIEIVRQPGPKGGKTAEADISDEGISPAVQVLQVVFDFPDGRKRPLVYTALFVDGALVDENLEPPFDQFNWNLETYTTSGTHQLSVQVRDAFGLNGSSMEIPVRVTVESLASNPFAMFQNSLPLISALAVLLAGSVLFLVMVVGGRLRPRALRASQTRRRSDPVTQPVHIASESPSHHVPGWMNRLQWSQHHTAPKAYAFLVPVFDTDSGDTLPPIPITSEEIILGSNPAQTSLTLNDPSVEARHARLAHLEDGSFRLADEGSIAGTWVNYTPVSSEGTRLEHGDLVHIGRVGFRFTLRTPTQVRKPVVVVEPAGAAAAQQTDEEVPA